MSYEYNYTSDRFTLQDIQDIENNPWIEVKTIENKGRCIYSKKYIPKGTIIFKDTPFSAIVDNQYKRNICNTCFKLFSESNRHNIIKCPDCGEINYCSDYCKQFSKIDTRHFNIECKWIHEFSILYKFQLSEDDGNIILLIFKILSRIIHEKKSLIFDNPPKTNKPHKYDDDDDVVVESDNGNEGTQFIDNASTALSSLNLIDDLKQKQQQEEQEHSINHSNVENLPMIPDEVQDLIDHLDEYLKNSKINTNREDDDFKKYSEIWKKDLKKLIKISLIIKNIIYDDLIDSFNKEDKENVSDNNRNGNNDEGNSEMEDIDNEEIQETVKSLKKFDLNILKLLCKIRSNYFGLWHTGYGSALNKRNHFNDSDGNNKGESINQYIWCGSAVYLKLSLFNHGCFPNCTTLLEYNLNNKSKIGGDSNSFNNSYYSGFQSDNRLSISIITLRDIKENQELLITYIPLNQKGSERYTNLRSNWMFPCDCLRCHYEKSNPEETEKIFNDSCCQNKKCSGGLLLPTEPNSNEGICRVCKTIRSPLPVNFDPLI